jgi:hypothetical protein
LPLARSTGWPNSPLVATTIANAQAREELSTLAAAEDLRDRASIAWVAVALAAEQVADGAGR